MPILRNTIVAVVVVGVAALGAQAMFGNDNTRQGPATSAPASTSAAPRPTASGFATASPASTPLRDWRPSLAKARSRTVLEPLAKALAVAQSIPEAEAWRILSADPDLGAQAAVDIPIKGWVLKDLEAYAGVTVYTTREASGVEYHDKLLVTIVNGNLTAYVTFYGATYDSYFYELVKRTRKNMRNLRPGDHIVVDPFQLGTVRGMVA